MMRHSRLLALGLSFSLLLGPAAPRVAWAAGSIIIEIFNDQNEPISQEALQPGQTYRVKATARDGSGKSVKCDPDFGKINGPTDNQIGDFTPADPQGFSTMTMGSGWGTAEITVKCKNPEVSELSQKLQVASTNTLPVHKFEPATPPAATPPAEAASPAVTAAPAAAADASAGNAVLGALLGVGIAAGVTALVIGVAGASTSPCTPPELACGGQYDQGCCPAGFMYICKSPANVAGCYDDIFITGCTLKYFCGSDY